MSDVTRSGAGAVRATEAVLRAGGGRAVTVLVPRPATGDDTGGQLGLTMPVFDGLELAPVLLREKASGEASWEMLMPASRAEAMAGTGAPAVRAFFAMAAGVVVDGVLMLVTEVSARECAGTPYLYRALLQVPTTGMI